MQIIKFSLGIIGAILLVGCSLSPVQPLLHGTETNQTTPFLPQFTPSSTATGVSSTPFLHASQTETFLPDPTSTLLVADTSSTAKAKNFHLQTHCTDEKLGIRDLLLLPGTLVFSADNRLSSGNVLSPERGEHSMISFWNPQLDRISTYNLKKGQEYYYYAESPDKEKLAFTEGKTTAISLDLLVLDDRGKELGRVVVPGDWTFFDWRNNAQLLLQQFRPTEKFEMVTIDLADKKQRTIPTNFPNIYLNELFWSWGSQVQYNPTAMFVLYPVRQYNPSQIYTVLWNAQENKEVARIAGSGWARWSPDGRRFVLIADVESRQIERQDDILLINTSGESYRATFFTEYYEYLSIEQPVWSPDSRYIAFWLITKGPSFETAQLGVLDTETLTVDLFCKEINPRPFRFGDDLTLGFAVARVNAAIPIWSPDSNYLLIEDHGDFESSVFVYDLRNYTITKVADKARPVGWLK